MIQCTVLSLMLLKYTEFTSDVQDTVAVLSSFFTLSQITETFSLTIMSLERLTKFPI
jgi:hypothetical protein